ncbi:hypothetical protein [Paenibacillus polymyxa]|uniref:Uncharacterized protein n=1 Tax=Paenibacillus polymyxa TaxID=1406 RepID=A0AAE9IAD8_PAEPO|nr:hypothetical protein [Paenibacillus polymyxa]URJ50707.1 hypothetical protein MF626_000073 [Paenibacillus polymyxa]
MKSTPCEFEVIKDVYWDNWGRLVKVFRKGEMCEGELWPDGTVSAESTIYDGISDQVDPDCIVIRKS